MTGLRSEFPYEMRIGVTGHRQLGNPEAVRGAVERLLNRIDSTLDQQDQTPIEWVIVSPLAKGADRIIADAVLQRPGARLEVISPFELDEYRKDFDDPEDLAEFERLLAKADRVISLVPSPAIDPGLSHELRNNGYLRGGEVVVDRCEIVIAVWNGRDGGRGGTRDVVRYAARRNRTVLWINSENPNAEPHMVTAEEMDHTAASDAGLRFLPLPSRIKSLSPGYHQLAAYNRDDALLSEVFERGGRAVVGHLEQFADVAGLPRDVLTPVVEHVVPNYVRADELASYYQVRHITAVKSLFYLSAFAVTIAVARGSAWH